MIRLLCGLVCFFLSFSVWATEVAMLKDVDAKNIGPDYITELTFDKPVSFDKKKYRVYQSNDTIRFLRSPA